MFDETSWPTCREDAQIMGHKMCKEMPGEADKTSAIAVDFRAFVEADRLYRRRRFARFDLRDLAAKVGVEIATAGLLAAGIFPRRRAGRVVWSNAPLGYSGATILRCAA